MPEDQERDEAQPLVGEAAAVDDDQVDADERADGQEEDRAQGVHDRQPAVRSPAARRAAPAPATNANRTTSAPRTASSGPKLSANRSHQPGLRRGLAYSPCDGVVDGQQQRRDQVLLGVVQHAPSSFPNTNSFGDTSVTSSTSGRPPSRSDGDRRDRLGGDEQQAQDGDRHQPVGGGERRPAAGLVQRRTRRSTGSAPARPRTRASPAAAAGRRRACGFPATGSGSPTPAGPCPGRRGPSPGTPSVPPAYRFASGSSAGPLPLHDRLAARVPLPQLPDADAVEHDAPARASPARTRRPGPARPTRPAGGSRTVCIATNGSSHACTSRPVHRVGDQRPDRRRPPASGVRYRTRNSTDRASAWNVRSRHRATSPPSDPAANAVASQHHRRLDDLRRVDAAEQQQQRQDRDADGAAAP